MRLWLRVPGKYSSFGYTDFWCCRSACRRGKHLDTPTTAAPALGERVRKWERAGTLHGNLPGTPQAHSAAYTTDGISIPPGGNAPPPSNGQTAQGPFPGAPKDNALQQVREMEVDDPGEVPVVSSSTSSSAPVTAMEGIPEQWEQATSNRHKPKVSPKEQPQEVPKTVPTSKDTVSTPKETVPIPMEDVIGREEIDEREEFIVLPSKEEDMAPPRDPDQAQKRKAYCAAHPDYTKHELITLGLLDAEPGPPGPPITTNPQRQCFADVEWATISGPFTADEHLKNLSTVLRQVHLAYAKMRYAFYPNLLTSILNFDYGAFFDKLSKVRGRRYKRPLLLWPIEIAISMLTVVDGKVGYRCHHIQVDPPCDKICLYSNASRPGMSSFTYASRLVHKLRFEPPYGRSYHISHALNLVHHILMTDMKPDVTFVKGDQAEVDYILEFLKYFNKGEKMPNLMTAPLNVCNPSYCDPEQLRPLCKRIHHCTNPKWERREVHILEEEDLLEHAHTGVMPPGPDFEERKRRRQDTYLPFNEQTLPKDLLHCPILETLYYAIFYTAGDRATPLDPAEHLAITRYTQGEGPTEFFIRVMVDCQMNSPGNAYAQQRLPEFHYDYLNGQTCGHPGAGLGMSRIELSSHAITGVPIVPDDSKLTPRPIPTVPSQNLCTALY